MNASILFIPMIISQERQIIKDHWNSFYSMVFWGVMTLAGIFGFLIGIVTIAQISLTSPLTHNIAGTAKAAVQTVFAVLFLGDKMTWRSAFGTVLVLVGSFMYSFIRSLEMDREKAKKRADEKLLKGNSQEMKSFEEKPLLKKDMV